jgi:hypothetical protein
VQDADRADRGRRAVDALLSALPATACITRACFGAPSRSRVFCSSSSHPPSRAIAHDKKVVGQPAPKFDEYEETPTAAWKYALAADGEFRVEQRPLTGNPFDAATTPVKLLASARKLPDWGLAWNGVEAFDPPASPVASTAPLQQITLVPFGSEELRVTDFRVLGTPAGDATQPMAFTFDGNQTIAGPGSAAGGAPRAASCARAKAKAGPAGKR